MAAPPFHPAKGGAAMHHKSASPTGRKPQSQSSRRDGGPPPARLLRPDQRRPRRPAATDLNPNPNQYQKPPTNLPPVRSKLPLINRPEHRLPHRRSIRRLLHRRVRQPERMSASRVARVHHPP